MPRRRSRKLLVTGVVTPPDMARTVVNRYVSEARLRITDWAREYRSKVLDYAGDVRRQGVVASKLEAWYSVLTANIGAIRELWARIKAQYKPPVAPAVAPTPPA